MAINGICRRQAVCVPRDCNVAEAAKLMRRHHAGHVVVVANAGSYTLEQALKISGLLTAMAEGAGDGG